jgi:alpha,alpha-trehalose-phosphate synthase [UDP-forming]
MAWTKERLEEVVQTRLANHRLVVVANREPYIHVYRGEEIECQRPASGVTTALDPVVRACGGVWVAHGSGDADRVASDELGRVRVPPDDPSYTLRRVWLSREEEEGYYYGFANSALWPLCHAAYTRPRFESEHWDAYRRVNRKFAAAVLQEIEDEQAIVFVQDYHFALLPRLLRQARPDLIVVQFWHIPWPNPEVFRVCPWKEEILDGLLGNNLLAFHTQYHCNNFMETVDRHLESRVCFERFAVTRRGQSTTIRPQPISVDPDEIARLAPPDLDRAVKRFRAQLHVGNLPVLVGVDRVDYIKGIPERLRAVDRLLCRYPQWRRQFSFVQVGAPSRVHIGDYRALGEEIEKLVEEINWRHGDATWDPIVYLHEHHGPEQLYLLYRMAAGCVVSSLHDGMNLVAKEFVAARQDEQGVLILSEFTGAARELPDAVIVNPYALDDLAESYHKALTMPASEQRLRMKRMRRQVADNNIYRWAGMLLSAAGQFVEPEEAQPLRRVVRSVPYNGAPLLKLSVS